MKLTFVLLLLPVTLLAQDDPWADEDWDGPQTGTVWSGFFEAGFGTRFSQDSLTDNRNTLEDLRWRVESQWQPDSFTIGFKADAGYDGIEDQWTGNIRDFSIGFRLGRKTDIAVGRQIQTWGTGDLVFLNDLFPKDFQSFFSGRDVEYLKAPGNAIRVTHYGSNLNVDLVWTPAFEPDRYLTGERFSFFSPLAGRNVAPGFDAREPREVFDNGEFALRLFRTIEGSEYALYTYRGFFKQPNALTGALEPVFAPMNALGASIRRPAGPGLFNTEVSYYASRDDRSGTNPLIPNSQFRGLAAFEWEAATNFNVALQYYLEWTLDHDALIANSAFPQFEPDERRHLITSRLTWRTGRDKYTWSLFSFYSPSDDDFYLRPQFNYRHSDQWNIAAGANVFGGDELQTFFNQLRDASNAYVRVRLNY